ncbi:unnamed protein product [Mytilus edulis]|uniref:CARD domain-containing protein n=1 Tax=Mytilus edulis TaxID=6550 RepID=A0A8S3RNZ3_MYTED|nr:unnamed protein product [Mytilus edulis]
MVDTKSEVTSRKSSRRRSHSSTMEGQSIPTEEDNRLQAAYTVLYIIPRAIEHYIDREYKGAHHRLYHFYDKIIQDTILDKDVLDLLISRFILMIEDRTKIEQHPKPSDRNKCILDLLIQRPEDSYSVLLEVLKESPTCSKDLIECMEGQTTHQEVVSQSIVKSSITGNHSVRLQKNYHHLTQNLSDVRNVIDSLISKGVLEPDDHVEIVSSGVSAEMNRKLIAKIRSEQDYLSFLEALKEDPGNEELASDLESTDVSKEELNLVQTATVPSLTNRPGFQTLVTLVSMVKDVQIAKTEPERHDTSLSADLYRLQCWYKKIITMTTMELQEYQQFVETTQAIFMRMSGKDNPDNIEIRLSPDLCKQVKKILDHLKEIDQKETEQEELIPKNIRVRSKKEFGSGNTPLIDTCYEGYHDMVEWLLHNDVDVDQCKDNGSTGLLMAKKNPNVDLCNKGGNCSLNSASDEGHTDIVKLLLEKNPNVDLCDNDGFTPLISSCINNHTSIVQLLIQHKPDINAQTYDGGNALYFSARNGNIEITQLLLENNADCNICIHSKQSITDTLNNHPKYVSNKSVDYAFDVVAGSSPLHIACFMGRIDVVLCLLDHNANINLTKEDGTTPLCYACEVGHEDIVRLLLDKGADTQIWRLGGKSPLQIATDNGHTSIELMLTNLTNKAEPNFS